MGAAREQIVKELIKSYNMEVETVVSYMASSIMLDGIRALEIRESLEEDIQEELGHAMRLGQRIKELDGRLPIAHEMSWQQQSMKVPDDLTDVVKIIRGVIEAEEGAIAQYRKIAEMCEADDGEDDYVTQDLVIELMADEEGHRRLFVGFLKDFE